MTRFTGERTGGVVRVLLPIMAAAQVLALYPYTEHPTYDVKLLLLEGSAALLAAIVVAGSLIERRALPVPRFFLPPLLGLLAISGLAALFSEYRGWSLHELRRVAAVVLLYWAVAASYRRPPQWTPFLLTFCIAAALASLYGFAQKFGLDPVPWADTTSPTYTQLPSTFGNPNVAGHVLILAVLAAVYLASRPGWRWCIAFPMLYLAHLFFTGHRAGFLALAAAIVVVAIAAVFARRQMPRGRVLAFTAATVVVLGVCVVLAGALASRMMYGQWAPPDHSVLLRMNGYLSAAQMIADRPLLGFGPGVYLIEAPRFWTPFEEEWFARRTLMNEHVHNDLLEIGVGAGVIASALYLYWLFKGAAMGFAMAAGAGQRNTRRAAWFVAAFFVAFAIDGLLGFTFFMPASVFLLAVVTGMGEGLFAPGADTGTRENVFRWAHAAAGVATVLLAVWVGWAGWRHFNAERLYYHGLAYHDAGRPRTAIDYFEQAEAVAPNWWLPSRERGMVYYNADVFSQAAPAFDKSLTQNPNWMLTLLPAASTYLKIATDRAVPTGGKSRSDALNRAAKLAQRATNISRVHRTAAELHGRAQYTLAVRNGRENSDEWREALEALRAGVQLNSNNAMLHAMLGSTYAALREPERALAHLRRATTLAPENVDHWSVLYSVAVQTGDLTPFVSAAQSQLERWSADEKGTAAAVPLALQLAAAHETAGRLDAADAAYEAAFREDPVHGEAWRTAAAYANRTGRMDGLRENVRRVALIYQRTGQVLPPEINALARTWAGAEATLTRGAEGLLAAVERAHTAGGAAEALQAQFRWVADLLMQEALTETSPERGGGALLALGKSYRLLDDPELAQQLFAAATERLKGAMRVDSALAWADALHALGETATAELVLDDAAAKADAAPVPLTRLGEMYEMIGKPEAALRQYQRALDESALSPARRADLMRRVRELKRQMNPGN